MASSIAADSSSTVRAAALRSGALSLAKASSPAASLDGLAHTGDAVRGQVVHDDDVAGAQARRQQLLGVRPEGRAVHGAVEDHLRAQAAAPQPRHQGGRLLMAVGDGGPATFAHGCSPVRSGEKT